MVMDQHKGHWKRRKCVQAVISRFLQQLIVKLLYVGILEPCTCCCKQWDLVLTNAEQNWDNKRLGTCNSLEIVTKFFGLLLDYCIKKDLQLLRAMGIGVSST
ncbi:uncharacterized protein LOC111408209 [Olea europaea var. sylvestris]|uniref:uncharacterized protein LOC111408209 n=1 Tax=Olea europaea var. sylvestris TaxID=158386 RepID=UPI000C1D4FF9|nr:uncharacterized protein LOC111408209 [Olea europaea var. sylvestris]